MRKRLFSGGYHVVTDTMMMDTTGHDGVFIITEKDTESYYKQFQPQVLRFDARTKIEKYHAVNFGACKGETFDRVLIYPNGPLTEFLMSGKPLDSPEKYYVGVTRPRYSIAFVMKKLPNKLNGFNMTEIDTDEMKINALRFEAD